MYYVSTNKHHLALALVKISKKKQYSFSSIATELCRHEAQQFLSHVHIKYFRKFYTITAIIIKNDGIATYI